MNDANPLISKFLSTAKASPEAVFLDGERRLTYGAATEEVTKRAQQLTETAHGLPVVLKGPNTVEWVLCFLAARASGLVVVPLAAEFAAEQWRELGEIIGPSYLFDAARDTGTLANADARRRALPSRAGICLPTSGSTGVPRCALRSDLSLLAEGERYVRSLSFAATDCILVALPLCHAFALGLAIGGVLAAACALYLVPRFVPRTVQRLLREGKGSILPLVPAAARLLCEVFHDGGQAPQGVRHIIIGAGPVTATLERNVLDWLGRLPARGYGSSETGATLGTTGQAVPDAVTGAALPGVEVAITGDGGSGALFVRTAEPFLGYLSLDGVDASRISPDGWYSTGDIAVRDAQGWVTIIERIGEGLRRGGRFIQPAEVERALKTHPGVADVLIVGGRDEHGEDIIEAHVEARTGMQLNIEELRRHSGQYLEAYKLPTVWHFYDSLPRTSGGKPDRKRLRKSERVEVIRGTALLSAVTAHRLSTAVIAAHRLGILAAVEAGSSSAEDIAFHLRLDRDGVGVLLELLSTFGVLVCNPDGTYRAVEPLSEPRIGALVEFEDHLQHTWLSVEAVEAVVRSGMQGRAFEAAPGAAFLDLYPRVIGASAKILALHAWRQVTLPQGLVLDIGCPAGALAEVLRQRAPDRHAIVWNLPPGRIPFDAEALHEPLAGIFVHNGVRRLAEPDCALSLDKLCGALHADGALVVSDIFIDTPSPNPWLRRTLMLDWLTHGNFAWPSGADLCSTIENLGFASIHRVHVDLLFELIIARKLREARR
jgi:acyl-CoA synthetase (AMP-forming)/AMP-acid ligase II